MNITITEKELEAFVTEKVQSGAYENPDDVVAALLHLVKPHEEKFEALRKEILRGAEDFQPGRYRLQHE
ncbi:MAG: type II toxin-antitoxin system ParD family antitoxin [Acidobacteria bacterium]|nr:type II toxin-antitoxin system ParD family antitoxin [Acidobacteriota bacterium]